MKAYIYSNNNLKGVALSVQTAVDDKPIFHLSVPTQPCRLRSSGLSSARCHRAAPRCGSVPLRILRDPQGPGPSHAGNYNSQQAAGRRGAGAARERTAVSSMATVLSRALKLPGKGCAPAGRTERGRAGRGRAGAAVPRAALVAGGAGGAA